MFTLSMKQSGAVLGNIDDADHKLLVDQLEEEHASDTDYYVCPDTIEFLMDNGASQNLLKLLMEAIGTSDGVEVSWKKC